MTLKLNWLRYFDILMRIVIALAILCSSFWGFSQTSTFSISENSDLKNFRKANPNYSWGQENTHSKWGTRDTLVLPFFDDFSTSVRYPDSSKWLQNQVYVNNTFGYRPPSINVATFDVLDEYGIPYNNTINKEASIAGDSLLSQPINLKDSAGTAYTLNDSIMLSFFYQPNGYGYHLDVDDSLRLYFKTETNNWALVWSAGGSDLTSFEHVIIPIRDTKYLHKGFQFLFTTITKQVGNANHWQLDYVTLDQNRSVTQEGYNDFAIQTNPSSYLKRYASMPYKQLLANYNIEVADSTYFRGSNMSNNIRNLEVRLVDSINGSPLSSTSYFQNANNIGAMADALRRIPSYDISSLPVSAPIVIDRITSIRRPGIASKVPENDFVKTKQIFHDYFAYDDGSAERGFGFRHLNTSSNIPGQVALGFELNEEDTLFAISIYFNQSLFDVSNRIFTYRVWQSLEGVDGAASDVLIYESNAKSPSYSSKNGERTFAVHDIDTLLVLQPGKFYIGWGQSTLYNLNIGWDMNYTDNVQANPATSNPVNTNLYDRTIAGWNNSTLPGTPMMRPHLGAYRDIAASVKEQAVSSAKNLPIYPNPATTRIKFNQEFKQISIYANTGNLVLTNSWAEQMDVSALPAGIYVVRAEDEKGQHYITKLIIFAP